MIIFEDEKLIKFFVAENYYSFKALCFLGSSRFSIETRLDYF